jgi:phosphatidylglycerophosphatase C
MVTQPAVAAFDFDGTITTSDSLRDFVRYTVGNGRLAVGGMRAVPWLAGMLLGTCDRGATKTRFLADTIGGMPRRELEAAAQRYAYHKGCQP